MADDYLDPRVNVVSSDADVDRVLAGDKRAGRKAAPDAPVDWGSGGQVDRSALQAELADNPNLHARLKQMIRGEVGGSASPEVRRIQMESVMNRALVRGHSLEQGLWDTGQYGNRGYYPTQTFTRGGYNDDAYQADLASVLGGSNYGGKYLPSGHLVTGNASADVARHQFQRGTPGFTLETGSGPESYFNEDAHRAEPMARLLSGGGPMTAAIASSRSPMQEASADVTGSVPQGRRPMASPMEDAMSPGILDRIEKGFDPSNTLQNVGAWLVAGANPAGGAALLKTLKDDKALRQNRFSVTTDQLGNQRIFDQHRGVFVDGGAGAAGDANSDAHSPVIRKARAEQQVKEDADYVKQADEALQSAIEGRANTGHVLDLLKDPDVVTGTGARAKMALKNIPGLGEFISPGGAKLAQADKLMAAEQAAFLASQPGVRVAGPELKFAQGAGADIEKPNETNISILEARKKHYENIIENNRRMHDYQRNNGGALGPNFYQESSKFFTDNPIYKPGSPLIEAPATTGSTGAPGAPAAPAAPGGGAAPAAPVSVKTPAEAAALPKGTRYMAPDGKIRVIQ